MIPLSTNSGLIGWVPHCDTLHTLIRDYREKKKILLNIEHRIMLRVRKHRNLCAWHFSIVRNVTFMKFWCMYIMVTHISTVWQSLCYVESANTWQIDTPLMLHLPVSGVQNYVQIMPNAKWLPQPRCCLNLTKVTLVTNTSRNVWVSSPSLYIFSGTEPDHHSGLDWSSLINWLV